MNFKLKFTFIFVVFALVSLGVSGVWAQGFGDRNRPAGLGNYRITGKVLLPDGQPAKDVTVTAGSADNPEVSAVTDVDGSYTVSGLMAGNYTVTVHGAGYKNDSEFVTISEGSSSSQAYTASFYLRLPGQPKRSAPPAYPELANVPKPAVAKFEKAMELMGKDDLKGAVPLFDEAIGLYPDFYLAYAQKGSALLRLHDADKAVEAFIKAIAIKPDYLAAKFGYGEARLEKKDYEVAAAVFDDVLKQKGDFTEARLNLGIAMYSLKNNAVAEQEFRMVIGTKGGEKLALAHLYLGLIDAQKKQNAEAITELQKYLDMVPKAANADKVRTMIADLKKGS